MGVEAPPLHLCDLSSVNTRGALAMDLTALMNNDLAGPQAWGPAIQNHPARVTAIKFMSRFTGTACVALFDRGSLPTQLKELSAGAKINS